MLHQVFCSRILQLTAKLIACCSLLIFSFSAFGQVSIDLYIPFAGSANKQMGAQQIISCSSGGYAFIGYELGYYPDGSIPIEGEAYNYLLYRVDESGELIWKKNLVSTYGGFWQLHQLPSGRLLIVNEQDGDYICGGIFGTFIPYKDIAIKIYEDSGDVVFEKQYSESCDQRLIGSVLLEDDSFVVLSRHNEESITIGESPEVEYRFEKFNGSGELIYTKLFPDLNNFVGIHKLSDGRIILLGSKLAPPLLNFMEVSDIGQILNQAWNEDISFPSTSSGQNHLFLDDAGNYILANTNYSSQATQFKKISPEAELIWEQSLDIRYEDVIETSAGDFWMVGGDSEDFLLTSYSADGDLLFSTTKGLSEDVEYCRSICQAIDGEPVMLGASTCCLPLEPFANDASELYINKSAAEEIVDGISLIDQPNSFSAIVYPNPSTGTLNLKGEWSLSKALEIKLFSLAGKESELQNWVIGNPTNEIPLTINTDAIGTYILQVSQGEKTQKLKLNLIR